MKHDQMTLEEPASAVGAAERLRFAFLSNHAHVLLALARDPAVRVRDIAVSVGMTERAVTRILTDLEEAGVIVRERVGRRNHYDIVRDVPLGHPLEAHANVDALLALLGAQSQVT